METGGYLFDRFALCQRFHILVSAFERVEARLPHGGAAPQAEIVHQPRA
jgi:hypothetical protein